MKRYITMLLTLLCLVALCACGANEDMDEKVMTISTPYADLSVPRSFRNNVEAVVTCEDPYTMAFRAKADGTELFTIIFNDDGETYMGALEMDSENISVYMNIPKLDETNPNYKDYCIYQDGINTILTHLSEDYTFHMDQIPEEEDVATIDIETAVVTMKYPAKWQNQVQIEALDDRVKFSYHDTPLFDLVFSECDGYPLGTYLDTPIYIIEYPVDDDEQIAMQEDVNVILQYLMEDPNFTISG